MRILNIGGGPRTIRLPPFYRDCEVEWLDVDETWEPDLVMDVRELGSLEAGVYDGVYGSHILEHLAPHDLKVVLAGILHILKDDGFADIRVPDLKQAIVAMVNNDYDPYTFLYQSGPGPITTRDVLYGFAPFVEKYGECQCHRNGFTTNSLIDALFDAHFEKVYASTQRWEIRAIAMKTELELDVMIGLGVVL
jgi:hypothetical protein